VPAACGLAPRIAIAGPVDDHEPAAAAVLAAGDAGAQQRGREQALHGEDTSVTHHAKTLLVRGGVLVAGGRETKIEARSRRG
jgi:hypothetical protein